MRFLRTAFRLIAIAGLTAFVYPTTVIGAALAGWARPERGGAWRAGMFQLWARGLMRILGVRPTVVGRPPDPPFFLVSNHLSYLDIVLLASRTRCVFVAKAEIANWPVFGALCRAGDTLFIDRGSKRDLPRVIGDIERILAGGRGLIVFPEGSSTKGDAVARFRPALLEAAASAGLPVSYAAVSYRTPAGSPPAHLAVCWWGDMPFVSHVREMLALPGIEARLAFGDEPIVEQDRKVLAQRLQLAVEKRFQPVV